MIFLQPGDHVVAQFTGEGGEFGCACPLCTALSRGDCPLWWSYHDFRGDRWTNINNSANRSFLKNAYRVLLTRARQGMVIFVPPGEVEDPTRSPEVYDATYQYLQELGIPVVS